MDKYSYFRHKGCEIWGIAAALCLTGARPPIAFALYQLTELGP